MSGGVYTQSYYNIKCLVLLLSRAKPTRRGRLRCGVGVMQGMESPFLAKSEFVQGNASRERFPLENGVFRTIEGSSQIGMLLRTVERWRAEGLRQSWCEQGRGRALGI